MPVPKIGVVLTDGRSNSPAQTWDQAKLARNSNITLMAIGVGNNVPQLELDAISSGPVDKNVFTVPSFDSLSGLANRILDGVCNSK